MKRIIIFSILSFFLFSCEEKKKETPPENTVEKKVEALSAEATKEIEKMEKEVAENVDDLEKESAAIEKELDEIDKL